MAISTNIAWCDATANFWIGCTKVSPACDHCYAEAEWDARRHRVQWGPHGARDFVKAGARVIRAVQKTAVDFRARTGRPPIVFINSLSDFADNHASIDPAWRAAVWDSIRAAPGAVFVILTKRPQNLTRYLPADWGQGWPNVILGTTAENQAEAGRRLPHLIALPAAVRLVSAEPLLGPLEISPWLDKLGWVIGGGESGHNARPCHPAWARTLRNQCLEADVPFFWKQWGEWGHADQVGPDNPALMRAQQLIVHKSRLDLWHQSDDKTALARIGLKATGHLLDGIEHRAFPQFGRIST